MRKRNWTVEDNLVALYIAFFDIKGIQYSLEDIKRIIPHKGFNLRVQQYIAIDTKGRAGLKAGLKSPLFIALYKAFKGFNQKKYASFVNAILEVKLKIRNMQV